MAATSVRASPVSQGSYCMLLILFSSALATQAVDTCRVPSLDYDVLTVPGAPGVSFIYTTQLSTCSRRVVGYWFCYQNTTMTGDNVLIATALLLQDRGANYRIIEKFDVEAKPLEDNCVQGSQSDIMQCCVARRLDPQFEVDLQLHVYGLVIPRVVNGPRMMQTHGSTSPGYQFNSLQYNNRPQDNTLVKFDLGIGTPATLQQVKLFQIVIDNSTSNTLPTNDHIMPNTPTADPTLIDTRPTLPPDHDWPIGSRLTPGAHATTLAPGSVTVTPIPTTSPGNPLYMAVIVGPAIATSVLVFFTVVIILPVVVLIKRSHSKETAGELYETPGEFDETPDAVTHSMRENGAHERNTQGKHIATAANEAYGCVEDVPVQNVAYTPAAVNILTVRKKADGKYGMESGDNTGEYDYVATTAVNILTAYNEAHGSAPDLTEEVQKRRKDSKTQAYQTLELGSMDYCSTYSKIHKQQTPMVEMGDHTYAIIDSTRVEPPSHYASS